MNVKRNLLLAAAFLATAQMASALTVEELVAQYQADGYGYIEVREGLTQYKIEAIRNGVKVEVIYDAVTGLILETESENVGTIGNSDPGVRIRKVDSDFTDNDDEDELEDELDDEDDEDEDDNDDNDDNDDDSNDDSDEGDDD